MLKTLTLNKKIGRKSLYLDIIKSRQIYLLIFPGIIWYLIFSYAPIGGLLLAFKTYKANLGIIGSPWVGMLNYIYVFRDPSFFDSLFRTLYINAGRIIFTFPFPVILAIALNEIYSTRYKKLLQTIFTFPQFLSWVIVSSVITNLLSSDGMVNGAINIFGGNTTNFLGSTKFFLPLVYISDIWKSSGWCAIIYLAAIAGIESEQYQAAQIDGASRWQIVIHITLPSIMSTIAVMFILTVGNMMNTGFDQIFNLNNAAVSKVAETLDMYIYRITFKAAADFSFSSAISLIKSLINFLLLLGVDKISKIVSGNGLFG